MSDLLKRQADASVLFSCTKNLCFDFTFTFSSGIHLTFDICLTHPRTVKKWYECVDSAPGFTESALSALKLRTDIAAKEGTPILCSLLVDEMVIKQQLELDEKKVSRLH